MQHRIFYWRSSQARTRRDKSGRRMRYEEEKISAAVRIYYENCGESIFSYLWTFEAVDRRTTINENWPRFFEFTSLQTSRSFAVQRPKPELRCSKTSHVSRLTSSVPERRCTFRHLRRVSFRIAIPRKEKLRVFHFRQCHRSQRECRNLI